MLVERMSLISETREYSGLSRIERSSEELKAMFMRIQVASRCRKTIRSWEDMGVERMFLTIVSI